MTLTDIEALRLKGADQPVRHQEQAQGDNVNTAFQLEVYPIEITPAIRVWKDNVPAVLTTDYTVDTTEGIVTFTSAPNVGVELRFEYSATVFSADEVQSFLDQGGGSTTLAAVYMLLAWSASAAKMAKKESLAGGGGLGAITLDTSVRSKELRETAKAYYAQWERDEGGNVPYEAITEIAWTPMQAARLSAETLLREIS